MGEKLVKLRDCPPGLFDFNGTLGFKTEYGAMSGKDIGGGKVEWTVTSDPDVYVVASGEVFWGDVKSREARAELMVSPLDLDAILLPTPPASPSVVADKPDAGELFAESAKKSDAGVTQADREVALAACNEALRNLSQKACRDVDFDALSDAFARHRHAAHEAGKLAGREEAEAVFSEGINDQSQRLGLPPRDDETPMSWGFRVRRAAIRALSKQEAK